MKRMKQRLALLLIAAILLPMLPVINTVPAAAQTLGKNDMEDGFLTTEMVGDGLNGEGVWITEIYNNDVNRHKDEDDRVSGGYVPIKLYDTTSDLMEFLEVVSTHDDPISFNDLYEISCAGKALTVTTMDGSSHVTLTKGQPVVLWHYRADVTVDIPTEADFRATMGIPEGTLVLKAVDNTGWDGSCTVSIQSKTTGQTTCTYTTTNNTDVRDGYSIELSLPLMGSQMEVYRANTIPSPGYVYAAQVRGLIVSRMEGFNGKGVYVTEIRPNDISRSSQFGLGNDLMECIEITNTTDKAVDLNNEYKIVYTIKQDSRKILPVYKYSSTSVNHQGTSSGCTVPAGGTAVLWFYRYTNFTDTSKFPTEADLRSIYSIPTNVPVYIITNQNSMNDTNRAVEVYQADGSGLGKLISSYAYQGDPDCPDDTSVHLQINPEGPEMLIYQAAGTTGMGKVNNAQITYTYDYGDAVKMHPAEGETIPEYIMQGEDLRVDFWYDYNTRTKRVQSSLNYRFDGTGEWLKAVPGECGIRTVNLFEAVIPAYELFDHDYVEFYVLNRNTFRATICGIYRVDIKKRNEVDGVRTNISEEEPVRGTVSITGNDGGTNSSTQIWIDGVQQTTTKMLEDGAYLSFQSSGIDDYFQTVLTDSKNGIIKAIGKWQFHNQKLMMVHIDNSHFTYSSGKYNVTLRIWAGTWGTSTNDYLSPSGNRDDFTISHIQLKLPNGKSYLPTKIGPTSYNGVDTSAKTNTSTALDAVHAVGDASKTSAYLEMTFAIPEADVNAVGVKVNTTTLSEGSHTLKVTSGSSTKEVSFIVDNTAPALNLGISAGAKLTGNITIDPVVVEPNGLLRKEVFLDGELVETPYETTAYALGEGSHTLRVILEDMAGNVTDRSVSFLVDDIAMEITDAGAKDITHSSAQLYLTAQTESATNATFYRAQTIQVSQVQTSTVDGLLPYIQYVIDVSDADSGDRIQVSWNGVASGTDDTHASTMYVQNAATGSWEQIGSADANGAIQNAVFTLDGHTKDGKATVIVQCTADSALPDLDTTTDGISGNNASWDGTSRPADYDFSFAWITDTQYYAQRYQYHNISQNQWIVDNAESWKIKYVIHTGDIVDDWDQVRQWENASEAAKIFDDAGMPYGVLPGNHDVASGLNLTEYYYQYFPQERFQSQPTFGGSFQNNYGHYDLVSENGQDFIIIYMGWCMYQEEIDWMNEVLARYSDRKAILCFHGYVAAASSVDGLLDYWGVLVRDHVIKKNPNVFAVLNGHYAGATYQTARFDDNGDGKLDRTVYQICTDYQSVAEGGLEYIKFLYFDLDNDQVMINSYSPYLDDFNYYDTGLHDLDAKATAASNGVANAVDVDICRLKVDFDVSGETIQENGFSAAILTDEVLGTGALTAGEAAIQWTDLSPSTDYQWYAELENANTGHLTTDVYQFTTEDAPVHDYQAVVIPPTCEEEGYTVHTCSICGDSYTTDPVAALGHSWVDANCTLAKTCTQCGQTDGNPLGHRYETVVTPPTCTENGYTSYSCSVCGNSYQDDIVLSAGHSYETAVKDATCTEDGYTTHTCTACGDSYTTDPVAATGHDYGNWNIEKHSTCTEEGVLVRVCKHCSATETAVLNPIAHNYVDGTCTNCGAADPDAPSVIVPTLTLDHPSLSFEGEIMYNLYFTADDLTSVEEMGLIAFSTKNTEGTMENAENVYPGYIEAGGMYMSQTAGVPARYLGDAVYFKAYAKLSDGSYVYSGMVGYNAVVYAKSILKNSSNDYMKRLVVAMINYGAEAQAYFCGKEGVAFTPMNNFLTADQQALINAYDASMVADLIAVDSNKVGMFTYNTGDFAKRTNSVSFDGAFAINYYFTAKGTPDNGMKLHYWNTADYLAADVLAPENATGSMDMVAGSGNQYWGQVSGIAAKEVAETYFVAGVYELEGQTYTTGILAYSLGKYCAKLAAGTTDQQALSAATAVYGYYAKEYFANVT